MRGGSGSRRRGNEAEAFVATLLQEEFDASPDGAAVLPLQQDAPADLVALLDRGGWCLYEVKSSKTRSQALSARLSPAEQDAYDLFAPTRYQVIRVWRHPGKPDTFEVVSRGA